MHKSIMVVSAIAAGIFVCVGLWVMTPATLYASERSSSSVAHISEADDSLSASENLHKTKSDYAPILSSLPKKRRDIDLSAITIDRTLNTKRENLFDSLSPVSREIIVEDMQITIETGPPVDPELYLEAPAVRLWTEDGFSEPASIRINTNYHIFVDRWQLVIYREGDLLRGNPVRIFAGANDSLHEAVIWDGTDENGRTVRPGERFLFVAYLFDSAGNIDESNAISLLAVRGPSGKRGKRYLTSLDKQPPREANTPFRRTIPVEANYLRLLKVNISGGKPGAEIYFGEHRRNLNDKGEDEFSMLLPPARYQWEVSGNGFTQLVSLTIAADERRFVNIEKSVQFSKALLEQLREGKAGSSENLTPILLLRGSYLVANSNLDGDVSADWALSRIDPEIRYTLYRDASNRLSLPLPSIQFSRSSKQNHLLTMEENDYRQAKEAQATRPADKPILLRHRAILPASLRVNLVSTESLLELTLGVDLHFVPRLGAIRLTEEGLAKWKLMKDSFPEVEPVLLIEYERRQLPSTVGYTRMQDNDSIGYIEEHAPGNDKSAVQKKKFWPEIK